MPAEKVVNLNGSSPYEYPQRKQPKKFNMWRGIYNKDKNYILGRPLKNWGELFLFYTIFYIVLAILFAICMHFWVGTLDHKTPRWLLQDSRIGSNPGLGFRPMPSRVQQGSLIWYEVKNDTSVNIWTDLLDNFLEPYKNASISPSPNQVNCPQNQAAPPGKFCNVDISSFGDCTPNNKYGYKDGSPCVFLKLNRIFGWKPEPLSDNNFPEEMPDDLKKHIASLPVNQRNQVFISCEGVNSADSESIGKVTVSPRSIPGNFYPYTNVDGYLSPLVSVKFENPVKNRIINVECIAWAKNIIYQSGERDRSGSVNFEIMVD